MGLATVTWDNGASIRILNSVYGATNKVGEFAKGDKFSYSELFPDKDDPTNLNKQWARVSGGAWDGKYVAVKYPSSSGIVERCSLEEVVPPTDPIPPTPTTPTFPDSFTLTDPSGAKAEYKFVRIIEE